MTVLGSQADTACMYSACLDVVGWELYHLIVSVVRNQGFGDVPTRRFLDFRNRSLGMDCCWTDCWWGRRSKLPY